MPQAIQVVPSSSVKTVGSMSSQLCVPLGVIWLVINAAPFAVDFASNADESQVDRRSVLKTFRDYLDAHNLEADWDSVGQASNETLINALAMMAPFGTAEKQALLEAPDLRARAETLVALTEMSLARDASGSRHSLQ